MVLYFDGRYLVEFSMGLLLFLLRNFNIGIYVERREVNEFLLIIIYIF